MIRALRSRLVACVLTVFTVMGTTGAWHAAGDDPDCAPQAVHDHTAHHERLAKATPVQAPTHCAICHWLQGFGTDSLPDARVAFADTASATILALARRHADRLVRVDVPSRAPPA